MKASGAKSTIDGLIKTHRTTNAAPAVLPPAPGHTGRSKRRDQSSVNGKLRASPQRQAFGDHLDAALIMSVCLEVLVSHQDVCGDSGTSLTADPGSGTFKRPTPCPENTRPRAGSDMDIHSIKRTPTAASCRSKWQREPQATEKQDPEECRVEGELRGDRPDGTAVLGRGTIIEDAQYAAGGRVRKANCAPALPDGGLANIEAQVGQNAFPKVLAELTLKMSSGGALLPHEGGPEFLKNRLAADAVVSGGCTNDHQCIQACTIAKGILVWTSLLDGASKLLRERACDNTPEDVASNQPAGTPARLSKGNNPAKSKCGQNGSRDLRVCEHGRSISERLRRLLARPSWTLVVQTEKSKTRSKEGPSLGPCCAEAAAFIRLLARARARSAAVTQRAACVAAFVSRWSGLLSIAAARSFAASLLSLPMSNTANLYGEAPLLSDVLADSSETLPFASRMG
ncbi:hypothetical protein AK812_SmicGene36783 [Symbiodinium microadriaticum]|uniref:Uncharacterized protein n=1 Tax=Symbiodinium microadriaticum TaxID=2951 RepID=A0A1Q9CI61_SYMMI|nr:hypothetical protein AK812_SmicGene36783 [Symbiodinium microadriaticum]